MEYLDCRRQCAAVDDGGIEYRKNAERRFMATAHHTAPHPGLLLGSTLEVCDAVSPIGTMVRTFTDVDVCQAVEILLPRLTFRRGLPIKWETCTSVVYIN